MTKFSINRVLSLLSHKICRTVIFFPDHEMLYSSLCLILFLWFLFHFLSFFLFCFYDYQIERTIKCHLSGLQTFLYQNYRNVALMRENNSNQFKDDDNITNKNMKKNGLKNLENLDNDRNINIGKLNYNNMLMQLRKICNHPYLLLEDVHTIPDSLYYDYIVRASGKLSVLDGILKELLPKGHKVSSEQYFSYS